MEKPHLYKLKDMDYYNCELDCPYFERVFEFDAKCKLTGKYIDFYDWFIAHCEFMVCPNCKSVHKEDSFKPSFNYQTLIECPDCKKLVKPNNK